MCNLLARRVMRTLRKLLESRLGPLTDAEFAEVKDLVETDVKINRTDFGKQTSLAEEAEVAGICLGIIRRLRVA